MTPIADEWDKNLHAALLRRADQGCGIHFAIKGQIQRDALARAEPAQPHDGFRGGQGTAPMIIIAQ